MDDEEFDEKHYQDLRNKLDEQFPNPPFVIDCVDNIEQLDEVFTTKYTILVKDDRSLYWLHEAPVVRHENVNYTVVKRVNGQPITIRNILEAMINDKHYSSELIQQDSHVFLEKFDGSSKSYIEFTACFGS